MRLHALGLKNIRSYTDETIEFPKGSVLLAGDIGAGKSTILLAIEFALFGLRRGEISGSSLLRHGTLEGKVSLTFSVTDAGKAKKIVVVRSLKRTSNGVSQDAGSITVDGLTTDMTAVELKAKVLELLNYPEQLLSQSKSFVFRYTVYTPQEQMKHILFEKAEDRLDTFRRLFAIDKYKQIRENAVLLAREIKNNAERLQGQADDLEELQKEQEMLKTNVKGLDEEINKLKEKEERTKKELSAAKETFEKIDKERVAYERVLKDAEVLRTKHESAAREHDRLGREVSAMTVELKDAPELNLEALNTKKSVLKKDLDANDAAQREAQKNLDENNKNEARIEEMIRHAEKAHKDIVDLDDCPTCKQKVPDEYKDEIKEQMHGKISKIKERQKLIHDAKEKLVLKLESLRKEQALVRKEAEELAKHVARSDMMLKRKKELDEKKKLFAMREKEQATFEEELKKISVRLEKEKIDSKALMVAREAAQRKDEAYQQARIAYAKLKEQNEGLEKQKKLLVEKITKKKDALVQAKALSKQHTWLTKHFSSLMFTIEKHVLMTLYHQFNDAFKEWFAMLVEEDTISVRLDTDFTPLIEQNGYETTLENLSGGEKTSVALAYRLALNKVINQALQHLRTDGLLILDEPTDGFSTEQLDRVQEVLGRLGLEQIIVVSHEQKMESFVDHVVRVVKNEHESKVF